MLCIHAIRIIYFTIVQIDPSKFIDECKYDLCMFGGDSDSYLDALCLAFEAYARECATKNVVLDWRSNSLCRKWNSTY